MMVVLFVHACKNGLSGREQYVVAKLELCQFKKSIKRERNPFNIPNRTNSFPI